VSRALQRAREFLAAAPLAEVIDGEDFPTMAVPSTPEAALGYARHHGVTTAHAVGSCAMGPAADDVLDPQLRVRGTDGLRVVDASVLPFQISANTAAPVMALAWLAADLLDLSHAYRSCLVMNDLEMPRLDGRTVVVTGSSSGLGAAAARRFRQLGATVAVIGRTPEKTAAVAAEIGAEPHRVDFSSLDAVRRLAGELLARYPRIDVLANNAGGLFNARQTTADGHEMTFQVNYLAPFLLTNLLLDRLAEAPHGARVISTVSAFYRRGRVDLDDLDGTRRRYNSQVFHQSAKLATIMFTLELSRRMAQTKVAASAFHPGIVGGTDVYRDSAFARMLATSRLGKALQSSPEQGAEPLLYLATTPDPSTVDGAYFHRLRRSRLKGPQAADPDLAARLWECSAELTGLPARIP
jgi:NAD(P)-dependent dehydrogenase (short-subunit alcohol dehydrogenase family)